MCEVSALTWTTVALNFAQSEKNDDAENLRLTISVAPISSAAANACGSAWITLRCACRRHVTPHSASADAPRRHGAPAIRWFGVRSAMSGAGQRGKEGKGAAVCGGEAVPPKQPRPPPAEWYNGIPEP